MRGKVGLASLALLLFGSLALPHADPLQIRGAWVAPLANLSSVWLQKKDLAIISANPTRSSRPAMPARRR